MKKFVTVLMMIVVMIQFSAMAEIEPYGGHDADDGFCEFIDNAEFTDVTFWGRNAYQKMWFANGWHIIAECEADSIEDVNNAKECIMHVYDDTYWIVESYRIKNNDEGEQQVWDMMYGIYTGELQ